MKPKHIIIILGLLMLCADLKAQKHPVITAKVWQTIGTTPVKGLKLPVITSPTTGLLNSEKKGWEYIEDLNARNTTTLFFQLKTDINDVKTDSDTLRYFKTTIRFGFKDDAAMYQLPGSFYIQEAQNSINYPLDKDKIAYKRPCIMFVNEVYYIFVPNYAGKNMQESVLFTFSPANGLTKQVLWVDNVRESGVLPYFRKDDVYGFALAQDYKEPSAVLSTIIDHKQLITRIDEYGTYFGKLESDYKLFIQPFFVALKPEPFKKVNITADIFSPYCDMAIFLNTPKDRALHQYLENLPVPQDFTKVDPEDWGKYIGFIYNKDSFIGPRVFYDEVPHTKSLVPDMPETKDQNPFGSCVSYAYAALYAQWINNDWQLKAMRKIDPNALKKETDISYFAMQQYFRGNKSGVDSVNLWRYTQKQQEELKKDIVKAPEFDFEYHPGGTVFFPLEMLLQNDNRLDSIPYFVQKYYFKKYGAISNINGTDKEIKDIFEDDLKQLYDKNHFNVKANSRYRAEITELSTITGIPQKNIDLQKAFSQPNFQAFMYQLFFNKCFDYISVSYRNNLETIPLRDFNDWKENIVYLVQQGAPVLIKITSKPNISREGHALLICGYKKLRDPRTGAVVDAFKLHNSWGKDWDEKTNGGWFLADNILSYRMDVYSFIRSKGVESSAQFRNIKALKEDWLETTDDYQRIHGNSEEYDRKWGLTVLGASVSNHQTDATPLLTAIKTKKITFHDFSAIIKPFFKKLGYKYVSEKYDDTNSNKPGEITYEGGITVDYYSDNGSRNIYFPTRQSLYQFKSKLDFSKINGEFSEERFNKGRAEIRLRLDNE